MAKEKKWEPTCDILLDTMVGIIRDSIIADAEDLANFSNKETVQPFCLEMALYKSIMTLNETNKANILKNFGPEEGFSLIKNLELRAKTDLTKIMVDDLKEQFGDDLPPEIKMVLDMLEKKREEENEDNSDDDL